ncbi:3-carboxyethylcatechol 2,3-dioxygenase [Corynebacterium hindlerae]|uniref:2,3-dihydroxyphenylpropionate/2,3-dihydroxicinnamic acid 1,2-dioxygenase n=1 Tax=Corynebacterium hindlerae TaxID=699041 RepID=A0A7G5FGK9_9CORY|nr:3-carboxyethylcatechol 2,3-dioxygenase [Corynebacterium hindlerae]QMV85750.1 3-carboxyethylcatechol 2,3-dioxygenase [Corynebacterium hindlerae]
MPIALLAMSHSPLLGINELPKDAEQSLRAALKSAKDFARDFDPDLIVTFAPDHYNGFFYDLMPPYCIGYKARSVGDYNSQEGELDVPTELAEEMAQFVIDKGIDIAISRKMEVDHGAVQPAEIVFGDIAARKTVPVYVNGLARPFVPMQRVRLMGEAIGEFLKDRDEKILLIASGGLSHDPPVPQWVTANEEQRALLLDGRNPTPEARNARQERVINTAKAFAAGQADIQDLNPEWDKEFMKVCASGTPELFDQYQADEMDKLAGHSSHEVRTWVAAFSALAAAHPEYAVDYQFYEPIKEYIAGFGIMTAS